MDRSTTGRALLASACAHSFDAPISRALMKANSRTTSAVSSGLVLTTRLRTRNVRPTSSITSASSTTGGRLRMLLP